MKKLIAKVTEDANKYGMIIEQLDELQDMFTVFANGHSLVVFKDGVSTLLDMNGDTIKTYTKLGSAIKALSKITY